MWQASACARRQPRIRPVGGSLPSSSGATPSHSSAGAGTTTIGATEADVTSNPAVVAALRAQRIELPSWAFGNSGTRFKVFAQKGVPRTRTRRSPTPRRSIASPGVAPSVALHIPWDRVDDYAELARHAADLGVRLGTINSNVFQDDDYMLGSVCNPDARVRRKALDHLLACIDVMDATGSRDLKLWFSDGTNYPGQDDIRARQDRLAEALAAVHARLGPDQRMLLEYKFFEPSFYTMDVPDWGTAYIQCVAAGPKAAVVVDTGHHAPGTNIEFIVASLLRAGRLGGFDFNSRFYADDDLMVGSADPFQLFRIMHEVVHAGGLERGGRRRVHARPVPQHRTEDPRPDPIRDERPGGDREGAPGRCRGARRRAGDAATCSVPTPS